MEEEFKIYIDQLKDGHSEEIAEKLDPKMMDINEEDLKFTDIISVDGQAYLAGPDMILCLNAHTLATMPCVICNDQVKIPVSLNNLYHSTPVDEIKSGIYNFKEMLRENILLATPLFAECHDGECPEREKLKKFFSTDSKESSDDGYHPFADL
jgi:uncharacterized metal-binding protein YceD (DUF177 family)